MYNFKNDYSEGAHPRIIKALSDLSEKSSCVYCEDSFCAEAEDMIRDLCEAPSAKVFFISGGTATNVLAIAALLKKPYEAAICAASGHINVHETGAVEYSGRKVIDVPAGRDGKLTPELVLKVLRAHDGSEHMVAPKLVYVSQSTETGAVYTKAELTALRKVCDENGLYLYLDGARLAAAMASKKNDMGFEDFAALTDAFYLGGTKNGFLFGEALVFPKGEFCEDARWLIKQKGFMLAKGFVAGAQFAEALRDGLYLDTAKHAEAEAEKIAEAIKTAGFEFYTEPESNQLFVILPNSLAKELAEKFGCNTDTPVDENSVAARIVTSWATKPEATAELCNWFLENTCLEKRG